MIVAAQLSVALCLCENQKGPEPETTSSCLDLYLKIYQSSAVNANIATGFSRRPAVSGR